MQGLLKWIDTLSIHQINHKSDWYRMIYHLGSSGISIEVIQNGKWTSKLVIWIDYLVDWKGINPIKKMWWWFIICRRKLTFFSVYPVIFGLPLVEVRLTGGIFMTYRGYGDNYLVTFDYFSSSFYFGTLVRFDINTPSICDFQLYWVSANNYCKTFAKCWPPFS